MPLKDFSVRKMILCDNLLLLHFALKIEAIILHIHPYREICNCANTRNKQKLSMCCTVQCTNRSRILQTIYRCFKLMQEYSTCYWTPMTCFKHPTSSRLDFGNMIQWNPSSMHKTTLKTKSGLKRWMGIVTGSFTQKYEGKDLRKNNNILKTDDACYG